MAKILYAVTASLASAADADDYVRWLEDGHVDAVLKAGAHSAMIVRLEAAPGSPRRVMTIYIFSTRALFEEYVDVHAPALRADGLKRFGPERGVRFERTVGEIV